MLKTFSILFAFMVLMISCSTTSLTSPDTVVMTIASEKSNCQGGAAVQKCLIVKKAGAQNWEYFYSGIEGFNHQDGYEYVLSVKIQKVQNPPADASSIRYILVKEISKTRKNTDIPISLKTY